MNDVQNDQHLEKIVRAAVHAELELVGLRGEDADARAEQRADMNFLRKLRKACDGAATKVGYLFIVSAFGIIAAIFVAGFKVQIGK